MKAFCVSAHGCGVLGSISDVMFRMESGLSFLVRWLRSARIHGWGDSSIPQNPSSPVSGCLRTTGWGVILGSPKRPRSSSVVMSIQEDFATFTARGRAADRAARCSVDGANLMKQLSTCSINAHEV